MLSVEDIVARLATLDVRKVLSHLPGILHDNRIACDSCAVILPGRAPWIAASPHRLRLSPTLREPAAEHAIRTGQGLAATYRAPDEQRHFPDELACMVAPLVSEDRVVGALYAGSSQEPGYTRNQLREFSLLAALLVGPLQVAASRIMMPFDSDMEVILSRLCCAHARVRRAVVVSRRGVLAASPDPGQVTWDSMPDGVHSSLSPRSRDGWRTWCYAARLGPEAFLYAEGSGFCPVPEELQRTAEALRNA